MARIKGWPPAILTKVPPADVRRGDGDDVIEFIEALCPQVKDSVGGRAGEPLVLRPWQKHLMRSLYARRADGRYRHRTSLVMLPRKSGKSALGSGMALFSLYMGPRGGEIYSCAADRDQARIVFGVAKAIVEASPDLSERAKLYRDAIEIPSTGSVYRVLSSEAFTKEGLSPTAVFYDELHAAPDRELWSVMTLAQAARVDAMTVALSTAGVKFDRTGQDSTCYDLWQYGSRVAAGEVDDPTFFMAYWGAPEDADFRDPAVWKAANPGYGDLQDPEDFDSAVKRTPENEFRTKRLNTWTSAQTAWLPNGAWDALPRCEVPADGTTCVLAFDGSFSGDASAIVGVTIEEVPRIWLVGLWEKQPTDRDDWRVDIPEVEAAILTACGRWDVVEVACDPFRWQRSMDALASHGVPIVEYPSSSPARMVTSTAKMYDAVVSGSIQHDGSPALARHFDNCVIKTDRLGPRIVKEHRGSPRKIDAAVCAVMGLDRATFAREQVVEPVYAFHDV